jgi:hypothetical protein
MSVVTLQRWSLAPQLERSDSIVVLLCEAPNELHPKIIANPRVAAVGIPMPTRAERAAVIRHVNPALDDDWVDKLADVTAGLKSVQIKSILQPAADEQDDAGARQAFRRQGRGLRRGAERLRGGRRFAAHPR